MWDWAIENPKWYNTSFKITEKSLTYIPAALVIVKISLLVLHTHSGDFKDPGPL